MLLSVSGRLVQVLDEIQYQSEIPDSTSWESNPDSRQLFIYRSFIYVFHLSCTYLQESRVGYLDYLADQKLLASTCWHDSYTQLLQLSATEYCLVIFSSHASNSKNYIQLKLLRILEVQKSFDSQIHLRGLSSVKTPAIRMSKSTFNYFITKIGNLQELI